MKRESVIPFVELAIIKAKLVEDFEWVETLKLLSENLSD